MKSPPTAAGRFPGRSSQLAVFNSGEPHNAACRQHAVKCSGHFHRRTPARCRFTLTRGRPMHPLPQEGDTAVGAFSRPEGLPRCRGRVGGRHAARAFAAPSPQAFRTVRRRPTDHLSVAGLLARTLSADTVLKIARARPCRAKLGLHIHTPTEPTSEYLRLCRGSVLRYSLSPHLFLSFTPVIQGVWWAKEACNLDLRVYAAWRESASFHPFS